MKKMSEMYWIILILASFSIVFYSPHTTTNILLMGIFYYLYKIASKLEGFK